MNIKGSAVFAAAILILLLVMLIASAKMELFTSKLVPLVVGTATVILVGIQLVRERSAHRPGADAAKDQAKQEPGEGWCGILVNTGWIALLLAAIYLVGFIISIPIYLLAYMRSHRVNWIATLTVTVGMTLIIWTVFERLVGIELYRGFLFTLD